MWDYLRLQQYRKAVWFFPSQSQRCHSSRWLPWILSQPRRLAGLLWDVRFIWTAVLGDAYQGFWNLVLLRKRGVWLKIILYTCLGDWVIEWVVQFTCLLWFHEACSPPHPADQGSQGDSNSYWLVSNRHPTRILWLGPLQIWKAQALIKAKRCKLDMAINYHHKLADMLWGGCKWVWCHMLAWSPKLWIRERT